MPVLITGITIFFIALIVVGYILSTRNLFKRLIVSINANEKLIDRAITKRFILLKKYSQLLTSLSKNEQSDASGLNITGQPLEGLTMKEKETFAQEIASGLIQVLDIIHNDVAIKESKDTFALIEELHEVEDEIQRVKRKYNSDVSYYNQKVTVFPSHFIANWQKYEKHDFFEADNIKE